MWEALEKKGVLCSYVELDSGVRLVFWCFVTVILLLLPHKLPGDCLILKYQENESTPLENKQLLK